MALYVHSQNHQVSQSIIISYRIIIYYAVLLFSIANDIIHYSITVHATIIKSEKMNEYIYNVADVIRYI